MTDIEKAANIIKDIAEKNPEATKELGKTAVTLTKAINVALAPISLVVWGYDKISDFLQKKLADKLNNIPEENIVTPPINIAGPTIEAMRFTGENDILREMYANLLATSMNIKTTDKAHPRYIEVIKNITKDEALILRSFIKSDVYPSIRLKKISNTITKSYSIIMNNYTNIFEKLDVDRKNLLIYFDNLSYLGIITINYNERINNEDLYNKLLATSDIKELIKGLEDHKIEYELEKGYISLTEFGKNFIKNVVN
ncbi:DUF4393 domain-containing protein [uncultured Dysgonomonas sp.]|uniref:DUF4393 domain-containing protein n=1 Tax=uncultured Dysgonomonas sp. TaxID=206096 RepID=A0A212JFY4_9BACT|nr:DUF4393 domain-containing protein [uncultured Dysgonomonas sp.]SBV98349.1 conserved hypothetical protein [uncultured Dysgonomonas sp.]